MSKVFEGQLTAAGLRFAIVVSRFNSFVTERLLAGAMDALTRTGGDADLIDVVKAPGSWEIPLVAAELAPVKPAPSPEVSRTPSCSLTGAW